MFALFSKINQTRESNQVLKRETEMQTVTETIEVESIFLAFFSKYGVQKWIYELLNS